MWGSDNDQYKTELQVTHPLVEPRLLGRLSDLEPSLAGYTWCEFCVLVKEHFNSGPIYSTIGKHHKNKFTGHSSVLGFGRGLNILTVQYVCPKGHSEIPFAETGPSLAASALPETNSEKFPSVATVLNWLFDLSVIFWGGSDTWDWT